MNSFLSHLVRRDHSFYLAAHLAAGILTLVLLSGAAQPAKSPSPATPSVSIEARVVPAATLVVASASAGR